MPRVYLLNRDAVGTLRLLTHSGAAGSMTAGLCRMLIASAMVFRSEVVWRPWLLVALLAGPATVSSSSLNPWSWCPVSPAIVRPSRGLVEECALFIPSNGAGDLPASPFPSLPPHSLPLALVSRSKLMRPTLPLL
ncbi:hypothetical protein BJX66DRAFT_231298 [Aspergillus keveii]|uniref:Uncharacterized protein n=1 Tax=Aspergillus keveii TaxID=714993 RepID=A0ABR4G2K3_9EURO